MLLRDVCPLVFVVFFSCVAISENQHSGISDLKHVSAYSYML